MSELLGERKTQLLFKIRHGYGLNENVYELLDSYFELNDEKANLFALQEALVVFILENEVLIRTKSNSKYKRAFLKYIIDHVEKNPNEEVNEKLFQSYIQQINSNIKRHDRVDSLKIDEDKYHLVFFDQNDINRRPLILEQHMASITNGTTGLHVWPACFQLIDYLKDNVHLLENKVVLEIGAGCGLLGLHCLRMNTLKRYIFTDSHYLVLKQIEKNVNLNFEPHQQFSNISIDKFDWTDLSSMLIHKDLDLILASDIIFDPTLIPFLVRAVKSLWLNQTDRQSLNFIIASTIRNEETYEIFLKELNLEKFNYERLDKKASDSKRSSSTPDCMIEILKIYL